MWLWKGWRVSKSERKEKGGRGDEPVESCLIGRVVEDLQELTSSEVEHELRVDHEVVVEPERRRVVLPVLGELLAEANQHPVEPPQDVGAVVNLRLEHRDTRHEYRRRLLVEVVRNGGVSRLSKVASDGGDAKAVLSGRVLVVRNELNHTPSSGSEGLTGGSDDFEIDGVGGSRGNRTDLPGGGVADTDLRLAHPCRLLVRRDRMSDETGDLELFRCLEGKGNQRWKKRKNEEKRRT
jgi:hypothetical protein